MDKYDEFCRFSDSLVSGLNAKVSGHACNAGFTIDGDDIDLALVYSSSLVVKGDGLLPLPTPDKAAAKKVFDAVASVVPTTTVFKLKAVDCIEFKNTTVGTGSRWQLRFRR